MTLCIPAAPAREADCCVDLDHEGPRRPFAPLPDDWVDIPAISHLRRVADRHPLKPAVHDRASSLTYRELIDAVDRLSATIDATPARHGTIALVLPNSAFSSVAALACLAAGRVFVPFNANHPPARLADLISDCALDAIVVAGTDIPAAWQLPPDLPRIDVTACLRGPVPAPRAEPAAGDRPAVILHTSGSSGRPRAIVISQASLLQRVLQHVNACHIDHTDQVCPLSSLCTVSGVREQFAALLTGATLQIVDPYADGLAELRRTIAARQVSILYAIPGLARALLQTSGPAQDFASLRVLRIGGDTVLWRDMAMLRAALPATCHIQISFSSTEAPGLQWFVPPGVTGEGAAAPIGYPVPGLAVEIVDEDGAPVPPGEFGELVLGSRFVALGLWQGGACVPGPFRPDPAQPGGRRYATGDYARLRPDGLYVYGGRHDRQVKIRGQRVDTSEVEAALRDVAGVLDAVAIATGDPADPVLIAFIQPRPDDDPGVTLRHADAALRALPDVMRPSRRHVVPAIARLPSSKPDIAALRLLDQARNEASAAAPALQAADAGRLERIVAQAWREALGGGGGGLSWSEAGGDSLRLLQFVLGLERRVGQSLPLELFDGDMRQTDIVAAIGRTLRPEPADAGDTRPIVLFFPGIEDDNPALARFRNHLREQVRFETLTYPDWQTMVRGGGGLDRFVDLACAKVFASEHDAPLHLAGYSFGGVVAMAVAARLIERGRHVDGLTVFDTNLENFDGSTTRDAPPSSRADRLAGLVFGRLTTRAGRTRLPLPLPQSLPRRIDLAFRWRLRRTMAVAWLARHPELHLDLPVTLFRTDDHPDGTAPDLGWSNRAAPVQVHKAAGGHLTMFWGTRVAALAERFEEASLR